MESNSVELFVLLCQSSFAVKRRKVFIAWYYQIIFTWTYSCLDIVVFWWVFFLLIGTLRPDLIESASSLASNKAEAIKTHHNDTDFVRALRAQVRIITVNTFADGQMNGLVQDWPKWLFRVKFFSLQKCLNFCMWFSI